MIFSNNIHIFIKKHTFNDVSNLKINNIMKIYEIVSENYWKNKQINQEFDKATTKSGVDFAVMINGKIWKRKGEPVLFKDHATALKAADRITTTRNITTQVIPLKRK